MQPPFDPLQQQQPQQFLQQHEPTQQAHTMPTPSPTPWNLNAMPWKLASIVGAQPGDGGVMQFSAATRRAHLHQKRKSDLKAPLPPKQFISEEKITAHFNGLHISSDYIQNNDSARAGTSMDGDDMPTTSGKCFTNLTYQDYQVTAKELEQKLKNASRITMCDEIKKLHEEQKRVTFLPEALINRIEKPCTALVLWQPPPIIELLQRTTDGAGEFEDDSKKLCDYLDEGGDDDDFSDTDPDAEIDDFMDNNNTCSVDFNNLRPDADGMDEDL